MKTISLLTVLLLICISPAIGEERETCRSLDTREFGLVSDGEISEQWSEVQLIEKYGPPCEIIQLGEVFIERTKGRIVELEEKRFEQDKIKAGTFAIKKQFIYKGDYSSPISVFTIVDGVVVKKERIR